VLFSIFSTGNDKLKDSRYKAKVKAKVSGLRGQGKDQTSSRSKPRPRPSVLEPSSSSRTVLEDPSLLTGLLFQSYSRFGRVAIRDLLRIIGSGFHRPDVLPVAQPTV